jgi:hypothetical protein
MLKTILTDAQKRKKSKGRCVTAFCIKPHKKNSNFCHSCIERKKQERNPLYFTYYQWLRNCKRRKKVNTVTFEQFKIFVGNTDYMRKRGRGAKKFNIARRIECNDDCPREWCQAHGYHDHNIKSITLLENLREQHHKSFAEVPF